MNSTSPKPRIIPVEWAASRWPVEITPPDPSSRWEAELDFPATGSRIFRFQRFMQVRLRAVSPRRFAFSERASQLIDV